MNSRSVAYQALPPNKTAGMVRNSWLMWVDVFIIQLLVPITFVFINLVLRMNLFRFVYIENYQRRTLAPIRYAAIASFI